MAATRPTFIDIRSQSHGPPGNGSPSLRPLTSPRLHVAGEVPPELSPLDAFAAQSRLLAQQLEKTRSNGRRISRLPPLTIEDTFTVPRPNYLRSISADNNEDHVSMPPSPSTLGLRTELEDTAARPISVHPTLGNVSLPRPGIASFRPHVWDDETSRGRRSHANRPDFGIRREQSPGPICKNTGRNRQDASPSYFPPRPSLDSVKQRGLGQQRPRDMSTASRGLDSKALAPPRSPLAQKAPSSRSESTDRSDDDHQPLKAASSISRNFSTGSGLSSSPKSPFVTSIPRTPSFSSDVSGSGADFCLSRPTFNFSRPLSRASEPPPLEVPSRQASSDSQPFILADDTILTPVSLHGEDVQDNSNGSPGAPSYVYSRFSLPRGKMLQRNSRIFQHNQPLAEYHSDRPVASQPNLQPYISEAYATPPSPPSRPSTSSLKQTSPTQVLAPLDILPKRSPNDESGQVSDQSIQTDQNGLARAASAETPYTKPFKAPANIVKTASEPTLTPSVDYSAEEHVAKGIFCHELGSFKESTYHLRIAARQNHPTGMLLYALACRHGWGMRPNQSEGVQWLRKAADCAILEVADEEDLAKEGRSVDLLEQKTRKAQFALSIYELGVSHMNGWGIEQDRVLALRCFEIAGAWGDGDALAEAGFCYAQGLGCRKDLQKSARFYRMAEGKGISMVGNSWIYKAKYKDKPDVHDVDELAKKKPRNKSRTRTMFGKRRSNA